MELRLDDLGTYEVGQELTAEVLEKGERVDVTAVSKGKGFTGVMKRHNFKGLSASHGAHKMHRGPGAIGACATPARVFKGTRMAGRVGNQQVTTLNLEVVQADPEREIILLKGAVPGPRGGLVLIRNAVRSRQRARNGKGGVAMAIQIGVLSPASGDKVGDVTVDEKVFGIKPNVPVMHQVVVAQLAGIRQGDQSTLTRAEVRGGGRKPWRQKGSGRARQGSTRAPHWRGGGVALGPKPRSYRQRTPKKMVQLALRSALSDRAAMEPGRRGRGWDFAAPKTKDAKKALAMLGLDRQGPGGPRPRPGHGGRSFRNLPEVKTILAVRAQRLRRAVLRLGRLHPVEHPGRGRRDRPRPPHRHRLGTTSHERPPRRHPAPGREREVLRAAGGQRLHVRRPPPGHQDRDPPRGGGRSSTSGSPT